MLKQANLQMDGIKVPYLSHLKINPPPGMFFQGCIPPPLYNRMPIAKNVQALIQILYTIPSLSKTPHLFNF